MDLFARALIAADNVRPKSDYQPIRQQRYDSFDSRAGQAFEQGQLTLEQLRDHAATNGEPAVASVTASRKHSHGYSRK